MCWYWQLSNIFPPFREMLYAGRVKLFAEVSQLFTQITVKVNIVCKNSVLWMNSFSGEQKD